MTGCVKHRQKCDIAYTGFVLLSHHPITGILVAKTLNYKANLDDHFQLSAFPFQFSVSAFRFRFPFPPFPLARMESFCHYVDLNSESQKFKEVVYNHWTGMVDWNGGMERWNH